MPILVVITRVFQRNKMQIILRKYVVKFRIWTRLYRACDRNEKVLQLLQEK
jgi:hypothetical protein